VKYCTSYLDDITETFPGLVLPNTHAWEESLVTVGGFKLLTSGTGFNQI